MSGGHIEAGRVIAGRYRIQDQLGEGGMGSVWRAEHVNLKSPVAIKFLNQSIADNPEMLDRFMREAQSAAALRGAYVVQIFDYGVEDGVPYIAMELLSGESLSGSLERQGCLSPADLVRIFNQVARAVSKAHERGIVHRDLKPDNIFIVHEGDEEIAKVLDFGIAKIADSSLGVSSGSGTRTGAMLGTPYYMSPEQARGNKAVDYRTDLWALAVIAFECLLGRRPYDSDALGDLVIKICTADAPVPSQLGAVPPAFDAWFAKGTAKEPNLRFQSAREMAESLAGALADAPGVLQVIHKGGSLSTGNRWANTPAKSPAVTTNGATMTELPVSSLPTASTGGRGARALWIAGVAALALVGVVAVALKFLGGDATDAAAPEPAQSSPAVVAVPAPVVPAPVVSAPVVSAPVVSAPVVPAPVVASEPATAEEAVKADTKLPAGETLSAKSAQARKRGPIATAAKPVQDRRSAAPSTAGAPPEAKPAALKASETDLFSDRQ